MQDYLTPCEVLVGNADCWTSMINGWPSYFNINPVPPITYWWIWMPLQEVTISIGTHTRSGSTMINTPWHVKIDTQELFSSWYCQLEEPDQIDLAVSLKARLELYIDAHGTFDIWQLQWMLSQEPWENPSCGGGVPLVTTWNYRCYCFAEKWSWKTRLNGSFPHLYPVAAWMNELM